MKKIIPYLFIFFSGVLYSQSLLTPLDKQWYSFIDAEANNHKLKLNTTCKPFGKYELIKSVNADSIFGVTNVSGKRWKEVLFNHTSLLNNDSVSSIYLSPIISTSYFSDGVREDDSTFSVTGITNTLGLDAGITYRNWANLNVSLFHVNGQFPYYQERLIKSQGVIPGMGIAHPTNGGYESTFVNSYLYLRAGKHFDFTLGYGKNFWGDGYRTFMISDNAFSYPYFKINTKLGRINYTNLFTQFTNLIPNSKSKIKYATFHHLSWNIAKWLNIGIYEAVVWQAKDSIYNRGFDVNYLNPFIFYRPIEYSLGSSDNSIFGMNYKFTPHKYHHIYGQIILDDFLLSAIKADLKHQVFPKDSSINWGWWATKYALQFGYKGYNLFGLKNLNVLAEYNMARPYIFSHSITQQSFGHINQPIAHPVGANFKETILMISYRYKRIDIALKLVNVRSGLDTSKTAFGKNVFQPYVDRGTGYFNYTTQGLETKMQDFNAQISYIINPSANARLFAGVTLRRYENYKYRLEDTYFQVGLKVGFFNQYFDYF